LYTVNCRSSEKIEKLIQEKIPLKQIPEGVVNLSWVEGIEPWFNGGLMVKLRGGDKVEVSRRQAAKFKDMMSL
jgi:two-component system LytT family response regulator